MKKAVAMEQCLMKSMLKFAGIMLRLGLVLLFFIMAGSVYARQQAVTLTGKVTDTDGKALPGVSILIKGTTQGTATDIDGKYSIHVKTGQTLVFSFIGYKTQEVVYNGQKTLNLVLKEETTTLGEVVAVGYTTQRKATISGSVATVKSEKLAVAPIASASNSLAGKLPGLISLQSSGQPGYDQASLSIRGFGNALVIVDGVESDFNNIDVGEIESVTILKDASASIYGSRAGNGVILVTTKRGANEKPTINLNMSYTLQGITMMPKPASAGQFAEMKAEAWLQSGKPPDQVPYTEEEIQKYYDGTDPLYPNTDWYDYLIRDWAPQQNYSMSVRGGSNRIKYYGYVGYLNQETIWKRNGGNYGRYNFQSNLDARITDNLKLRFDMTYIYENRAFPWRPQNSDVWQDFWNTWPIYPATLPDQTKISYADGAGTGGAHVTTNRAISGYSDTKTHNLKGTISLNYSFDKFMKGLSAKAFVNGVQSFTGNKHFTKPVDFYTYDPESDTYTLAGSLGKKASMTQRRGQSRVITGQFSMMYDNQIAPNHHLTALALYEVIDYYSDYISVYRRDFLTPSIDQLFAGSTEGMTNYGAASEMGRKSYVGRINYSYKNRYLVETILRADASAKFPPSRRWGYFPSVSVGWRLSEEPFMQKLDKLDNLKMRLSYGRSGNDGVGNFQYLSGYKLGHLYILNNQVLQGLVSTGLPNPDLTWENISVYNAGLDFSFFNKQIYGSGDVFYRIREGIPATRITSLPSSFGASLPPENINSLNNRGFEFQLGTSGNTHGLTYDINGQLSWSRAQWMHYEEPEYDDPDQKRIYKNSGRWTDRQYGYISDGLFTSQEEIDALDFDQDQQGNISLRPGDIRYVDVNKDGILDWKDQVEIGKGVVPHWMVGFNVSLSYRNFDLYTLFQGAFGYYNYVTLLHGNVPPAIMYDLRWTEENNDPHASVPRLGGAATNNLVSDFYYKKAGYMRLKNMSLGYNLPKHWLESANIEKVRIYFSGVNLLTFDKLRKYHIDPESPSGRAGYYYPQQRTLSFGIDMSF